MVGKPDEATVAALRAGPGGLRAARRRSPIPVSPARWPQAGVTAVSLDMIPRTLPRAQPMDALTSQANIAGYKAALLGGRPRSAGSSRC